MEKYDIKTHISFTSYSLYINTLILAYSIPIFLALTFIKVSEKDYQSVDKKIDNLT